MLDAKESRVRIRKLLVESNVRGRGSSCSEINGENACNGKITAPRCFNTFATSWSRRRRQFLFLSFIRMREFDVFVRNFSLPFFFFLFHLLFAFIISCSQQNVFQCLLSYYYFFFFCAISSVAFLLSAIKTWLLSLIWQRDVGIVGGRILFYFF